MPDSAVSNEEFADIVAYSLIYNAPKTQANLFGFEAELETSSNTGADVSMFNTIASDDKRGDAVSENTLPPETQADPKNVEAITTTTTAPIAADTFS